MNFAKLISFSIAILLAGIGYPQNGGELPTAKNNMQASIITTKKAIFEIFQKEDSIHNYILFAIDSCLYKVQQAIEKDSKADENTKLKYLYGLNQSLHFYQHYYNTYALTQVQLLSLIKAYDTAFHLQRTDLSILPIIKENDFIIGLILLKTGAFQTNPDFNSVKNKVILKAYQYNPDNILVLLFDYPEVLSADSLLQLAAYHQPEEVYIYAQARHSKLGQKILENKDPLIQMIAKIADMDEGRLYFPFLSNLVSGEMTLSQISKTFGDINKTQYYKLLVSTHAKNAVYYTNKSASAFSSAVSLMEMLKSQAIFNFIKPINDLHDKPDPVRLKVLDGLDTQDLYYLIISGEDELYTSSYLLIYNRIFTSLKGKDGYELLKKVQFNFFRRFIKMASNFNTLKDFLSRMDKVKSDSLMRSFVSGIEHTNNLEEAVNVADSYASLPSARLRQLILSEVQNNLTRFEQAKDKTGTIIYGLLNSIFQSLDTTSITDLSTVLGLPPVYRLTNTLLQNEQGVIIMQHFFYGDDDGKYAFNIFMQSFNNTEWQTISKQDWVEIHSAKGKPMVIYANKPLNGETFLDIKAQEALCRYLTQNNYQPAIIVHRGHSYYVKSTIRQLSKSAKLVFLGSCGGYNNLNQIISTCPNVHIIATKQLGTGSINQPIISYITEQLRQGKDLIWPDIWKYFAIKFKNNERFKDYIPPYQNLGAIFIMAFNKTMENAQ